MIVAISPLTLHAASEEQEYNEAWAQFQSGNTAEALRAFTRYIAKHPRGKFLPEAHFTLARIEPSGNNAFIHYQFIVDNFPGHELASQSSYATAQYYQSLGAQAEAKARYLSTYSRYPGTAAGSESLYRLALVSVAAESLDAAAHYAQAFRDNYPGNPRCPSLLAALADFWQAKGDTGQADPYWREIIASYPGANEAGNAREQLLANSDSDETADSAATTAPAPRAGRPAKGYYIQIGAYTNYGTLTEWVAHLSKRGYACLIDSAGGPPRKVYRLQVGPYDDRASVQEAARRLKAKERVDGIIVQR
ncbi:MAG TPA: SPOR domain-containing protein [Candidatus Edwardsbacteria bacterium]|nr:SPOR domain-containing protein [Candidatus Edwardsbacteria bacterium]